jgi:hypothetical protein
MSCRPLGAHRFLKGHLLTARASFIPERIDDRVDLATLYLVQASVADSSAEAMPYPEFVARGWAVPNITNYHPFNRLGLWCAYMKEFSTTRGLEDPDRMVAFAKVVSLSLMDSFNVVDNPIRFPLLEPVRARRPQPSRDTEVHPPLAICCECKSNCCQCCVLRVATAPAASFKLVLIRPSCWM